MVKPDVPFGRSLKLYDDIFKVGVLGRVTRVTENYQNSNELLEIEIQGQHRIRSLACVKESPLVVNATTLKSTEPETGDKSVLVYRMQLKDLIKQSIEFGVEHQAQYSTILDEYDLCDSSELADTMIGLMNVEPIIAQRALETVDVKQRLLQAISCAESELEILRLEKNFKQKIKASSTSGSKKQKRNILIEQYKTIRKELGMDDNEKENLVAKFESRLTDLTVPDSVMDVIVDELNKLGSLEQTSSEFNVTRNYLDWLTSIPWGKFSVDRLDPVEAEKILDEDHFGLEDIKKRILEFISVGTLTGSIQGKILCFAGPPGVGKTSIGKSVARALNREFYKISVGGMTDVAEIKGHRRTYVGSMPGKVIQALKITKTQNPVILIDEIDKLGRGITGDPASALLETLDPSQNTNYMDHYCDVPIDLSKVVFLATANDLSTIPRPLMDRMEILNLSGYVAEEKLSIAKTYLIPRSRKSCGLKDDQVHISEDALTKLIRDYCREPGVRNLERYIDRICRQIAHKIATESLQNKDEGQLIIPVDKKFLITLDNLSEYAGRASFSSDVIYEQLPPGVATGLAWTSMGGSTLVIESIVHKVNESNPGLKTTGQMGGVMKESSEIALSFAKAFLRKKDASNDFFDKNLVHMHVPEGAVKKDGPSAGCTMVTSLLSMALNQPVRNDSAMTGEITLHGKILSIGGVKEKCIAARRSGIHNVILPASNKGEYEDLPEIIVKDINPIFVDNYQDIFDFMFSSEAGSNVKTSHAETAFNRTL